ncbi:hypothetical protein A1351_11665 [Methylosinus sp. R-45379]|nr:hypothetical protein A1351_11665 [Methylosinus sp. R-45379]
MMEPDLAEFTEFLANYLLPRRRHEDEISDILIAQFAAAFQIELPRLVRPPGKHEHMGLGDIASRPMRL